MQSGLAIGLFSVDGAEPFADRAGRWTSVMEQAADLLWISRDCMSVHLCSLAGLAGLGPHGDQM